jgi:RHS repeat-associated protein
VHLEEVDRGANVIDFGSDEEGRHDAFTRSASGSPVAEVGLSYDGRSFLRRADELSSGTPTGYYVAPTYSSQGVLHALLRQEGASAPVERISVFYLAGRPVAQVRQVGGGATWTYLTTDHLGTPVHATDAAGVQVWLGPLRPFGEDAGQGTPSGALDNGIFLRLPGQWEDVLWADATSGADVFYNLHRWYETGTGRYSRPDPLGARQDPNVYLYAAGNPLGATDPLGLLCQLSAPWKKCLSRIFGAPIDQVRVIDHARAMAFLHFGRITTRRDTIFLPRSCGEFWNRSDWVLEEYYHVLSQWNLNRTSVRSYLLGSGIAWLRGKDPYEDNPVERQAKFFAEQNRKRFEECVGCVAWLPPEPTSNPLREYYITCGRFGELCKSL